MRIRRIFIIFSIFLVTFLVYFIHSKFTNTDENNVVNTAGISRRNREYNGKQPLTIAVVACGQRFQDTVSMIKSALLFNKEKEFIYVIVFTEPSLMLTFQEKLSDWRLLLPGEFDFEIRPLQFPPDAEKEWKTLFKPCAAQRLFLPSLLDTVDSILYVDTDTVFLSPISDIWKFFNRFNSTQIAALTPEHEDENAGWYNRFARHPYYGRLGVNSGVMLMNLTRMRDFGWESRVQPIYTEYKLRITWGDQDIINILFYYHPEKLFLMPCEYNYRPDHCMYMSVCDVSNGVKVMHGNRGYFQSNKQPLFRAIYEAIEGYQIGADVYSEFLVPLESSLSNPFVSESNCGVVSKNAIKVARNIFSNEFNYKT